MNTTNVSATNALSNSSLSRLQAAVEPYGYLLIRFTAGLLLAPHGAQKLFGWFGGDPAATVAIFNQIGLHPAGLLVPLVGAIEFFGGLAVAFGILTRFSALACAVVLAVATLVLIPRGYFGWAADWNMRCSGCWSSWGLPCVAAGACPWITAFPDPNGFSHPDRKRHVTS